MKRKGEGKNKKTKKTNRIKKLKVYWITKETATKKSIRRFWTQHQKRWHGSKITFVIVSMTFDITLRDSEITFHITPFRMQTDLVKCLRRAPKKLKPLTNTPDLKCWKKEIYLKWNFHPTIHPLLFSLNS